MRVTASTQPSIPRLNAMDDADVISRTIIGVELEVAVKNGTSIVTDEPSEISDSLAMLRSRRMIPNR